MEITITLATVAAVTTGLVQIIKGTKGLAKLCQGREQLIALAAAMIISLAGGLTWFEGLIAGLMSMGIYSTAKLGVDEVRSLVK